MKKVEYKNDYFSVVKEGNYSYIDYGRQFSGVVILPIVDKEFIVLIKNYRFPLKTDSWELPRGFLDKSEKPWKAAQRELREETGYLSQRKDLKTLGFISPDSGAMSNYVPVIRAEVSSKKRGKKTDPKEGSEVTLVEINKIDDWLNRNKVFDSFTLSALMLLKIYKK